MATDDSKPSQGWTARPRHQRHGVFLQRHRRWGYRWDRATTLQGCGTPTPTPTATATTTGTPSPTPTCQPGGSPGPWTQAAPVAIDHYGGFMDSDGTFAYEGGGYSFTTVATSTSSGSLTRRPTPGRLWRRAGPEQRGGFWRYMRPTSTSSSSSAATILLPGRWSIQRASTT